MAPPTGRSYRLGPFELDGRAFALRQDGKLLRIEHCPLELVLLLAARDGALVTREDIDM